jgi:hypothetical protein
VAVTADVQLDVPTRRSAAWLIAASPVLKLWWMSAASCAPVRQPLNHGQVQDALRAPALLAGRYLRAEKFVKPKCLFCQVLRRKTGREAPHRFPNLQLAPHSGRLDSFGSVHGTHALFGAPDRNGLSAELDPELVAALLPSRRFHALFVRFDAPPFA